MGDAVSDFDNLVEGKTQVGRPKRPKPPPACRPKVGGGLGAGIELFRHK
jgi:hypothetical protein